MNTKQQPRISERVYQEVVSRIEHGKVPIYPSLIRRRAIERYKAEKIVEIERAKRETERKIREEQRRREERRREERRRREQMRKALEATKKRVHVGSWVKILKGGKSATMGGIAAMSPSQAKALGYKWGTVRRDPKTGLFEFVPLPGEPTEAEYYGILKWKYESGHYKRPEVAKRIKEEIEIGAKKYGIVAPAWAGGYLKEYREIAKQIREAYLKAAESGTKPSAIELKKVSTMHPPTPRPISPQDITKYQELATLAQHPDVQAYISKMKTLQAQSEQLQALGTNLQRQTEAYSELVEKANKAYEEYKKGGWTPEEVVRYGLLTGTVSAIEKQLEPKIRKYEKAVKAFESELKQPKPTVVKKFEKASKAFMEQYSPEQISQIENAMIVTFPNIQQPSTTTTKEPQVTWTDLGLRVKAGEVPVVHIDLAEPEQTKPPSSFEASVEPIKSIVSGVTNITKRITGYYPEKEEALRTTMSMYKKHQLDVAESLGVIHKEKDTGKRYIIVNNTKYIEGTKGFDEHLGEAIQSKLSIKEPPEVKRRQEAIRRANRALSEFLKSYGGKPGEPIILTTPESKKAFEKVKSAFESIPEETATTKAYWEEVGKIQKAQPQLQELNILAEQATKQAKEMEKIRKESWFGIPYKIESLETKYSPFMKKFIPPITPSVMTKEDYTKAIEDLSKWEEKYWGRKTPEEEKKALIESYEEGQKVYGIYRRMFGLPPEPFEWEKKVAKITGGIKAGQIEEIRAHPVKGAITVASFAALPPVFKGAGAVWKGAGLATKLPHITKYAPKIIFGAMGAGYVGGVGYETYKAPTLEKKGEVLGRTSVEIAEMAAGTYMGIKLPSRISLGARGLITRLTRKKIPLSQITTEELATGKKQLGKVPEEMTGSELVKHFKEMQYKHALPGEEFKHGVKVWRAAPVEYREATTVRRGEFEMPGMYTAPYAVPHFLRIEPPKVDIELFGLEPAVSIPAPKPTYYRFTVKDILRVPSRVRRTGIFSGASWFIGRGRTGRGYISIPFEYGKREAESVLPVTTGLERIRSEFYSTTPKGGAIPIEEMGVFETHLPRVPVGVESGKYYVKRPRGTAIIETKKGIIVVKGKHGEGYILPGGEIDTRAIKALRGEIGERGETALEGTIREIHEELGLKAKQAKRLFKLRGKGISLYSLSSGRQHWYSKNIYDVFKIDTKGRLKLQKEEISGIEYYKPGKKIKLSEDTKRILERYFKLKEQLDRKAPKDVSKITKRIIGEKKKGRVKKGEPRSIGDILKEEQEYYAQFPKKMSLISPEYLGIKAIISSTGIPIKRYKKIQERYTMKPLRGERFVAPRISYKQPTAYQYQKYLIAQYPEISYPEMGYPEVGYPQLSYPKAPEIPYPETGYPESSYPKIPCPEFDYFKPSEIPYPGFELPPVSPPYTPSLTPRLPPSGKKKIKHKKHIKKSPYEWFEYHPIPTLEEMFSMVGLPQQKSRIKAKHSTEITSAINQIVGKTPKL